MLEIFYFLIQIYMSVIHLEKLIELYNQCIFPLLLSNSVSEMEKSEANLFYTFKFYQSKTKAAHLHSHCFGKIQIT